MATGDRVFLGIVLIAGCGTARLFDGQTARAALADPGRGLAVALGVKSIGGLVLRMPLSDDPDAWAAVAVSVNVAFARWWQ